MTVASNLAFWSGVALLVRSLAVLLFVYSMRVQVDQFQFKTNLQPLKRWLLIALIAIILSNLPILYLHWERLIGHSASEAMTSFATVTNAFGMLVAAVCLVLVYRFKGVD